VELRPSMGAVNKVLNAHVRDIVVSIALVALVLVSGAAADVGAICRQKRGSRCRGCYLGTPHRHRTER
jgi:hypothetical protein